MVESKIDIEIDGDQHYLDPKIAESDKKRDKFLQEQGWKIIRIKWSAYKKLENKKEFVYNVLNELRECGEMVSQQTFNLPVSGSSPDAPTS